MLILIDADPIVYRCGFASEQTSWKLIYENAKGEVDEIQFNPSDDSPAGTQMREWLDYHGSNVTVLDKSRVVKADPVSFALRATKVQIESIITECEAKFKQPGKMLMWISGRGGSFRDRIATVRPYKGNRDPTHKPVHYDAIREYLRASYNSYLTSGIEADDAVSIFAHNQLAIGGEFVVCTIDKDLDQIPGNHYNYMNKVFYAVTNSQAERWFAHQCISGDTTDNIPGAFRCGDAAADKLLGELDTSAFGSSRAPDGRAGADAVAGAAARTASAAVRRDGAARRARSVRVDDASSVRSDPSPDGGQRADTVQSLSAAHAAVSDRAHDHNAGEGHGESRGQPSDSVNSVDGDAPSGHAGGRVRRGRAAALVGSGEPLSGNVVGGRRASSPASSPSESPDRDAFGGRSDDLRGSAVVDAASDRVNPNHPAGGSSASGAVAGGESGDHAGIGSDDSRNDHREAAAGSIASAAGRRTGVEPNVGGRVRGHSSAERQLHGHGKSSPRWWPTVLRAYIDSQRKSACPYAEADPEAIAIEMAQLVHLQTYPGQLWHPHGDLVVPGFGEENFDG